MRNLYSDVLGPSRGEVFNGGGRRRRRRLELSGTEAGGPRPRDRGLPSSSFFSPLPPAASHVQQNKHQLRRPARPVAERDGLGAAERDGDGFF